MAILWKYTKNLAQSSLAAGYTAGSSSITVQTGDGAKFDTGPFAVAIGNPPQFFLKVTSVATDVFTVDTSGFDGSTAVSVAADTPVTEVITQQVLADLLTNAGKPFPLSIVQECTAQSAGSGITVTFPSTLAASGNTAFMLVGTDGSQTITPPAGWTVDINVGGPGSTPTNYARFMLLHKTSAGDTSASFSASAAATYAVYFFEVIGSHVLDQSSTGSISAGPIVMPPITPTLGAAVFAVAVCLINSSWYGVPLISATVDPAWNQIGVQALLTVGGRFIVGHVYKGTSNGTLIQPPVISVTGQTLFSGADLVYGTFSIL